MRQLFLIAILFVPEFVNAQTKLRSMPTAESLCQRTLKSSSNTLRLGGFEDIATGRYQIGKLIPVYSDSAIQAYVDAHTIDAAVKIHVNGNFGARVYFVYRDETARLRAIAGIDKHTPIAPNKSCSIPIQASSKHPVDGAVSGTFYRRDVDCADVNGTEEGRINDLKYIMMKVQYSQAGLFGVVLPGGSGHIPGPLLRIDDNLYLAPRNCAKSLKPDEPGQETIMGMADQWSDSGPLFNPAFIGRARSASYNGRTTAPDWHPLMGDLIPAEDSLGFNPIKVSAASTPLMYQVLQNIDAKIQESMSPH